MKNLVLILFLICNAAFSQTVQGIGSSSGVITPAQAGISYREVEIEGSPYIDEIFKKDINDGLSQNIVISLELDKRGFLWLGTLDGLNVYDCNEFT